MKIIGRRATEGHPLRDAAILQRTARRLRGDALVPRGLYRFATHEEADTWMMRTIARTHARRNSKTSSGGQGGGHPVDTGSRMDEGHLSRAEG